MTWLMWRCLEGAPCVGDSADVGEGNLRRPGLSCVLVTVSTNPHRLVARGQGRRRAGAWGRFSHLSIREAVGWAVRGIPEWKAERECVALARPPGPLGSSSLAGDPESQLISMALKEKLVSSSLNPSWFEVKKWI